MESALPLSIHAVSISSSLLAKSVFLAMWSILQPEEFTVPHITLQVTEKCKSCSCNTYSAR